MMSSALSYYFGMFLSCTSATFINVKLFNIILAVGPLLFLILFSFIATETPLYWLQQQNENMKINSKELKTFEEATSKDISDLHYMGQQSGGWFQIFKYV